MQCPKCKDATMAYTVFDEYTKWTCTQCNHVFNEYRLTPAQIEAVRKSINCPDHANCTVCDRKLRDAFTNILNLDKITEDKAPKCLDCNDDLTYMCDCL